MSEEIQENANGSGDVPEIELIIKVSTKNKKKNCVFGAKKVEKAIWIT
jgi:hypothetical protein